MLDISTEIDLGDMDECVDVDDANYVFHQGKHFLM